jgi:putative transposase
MRYIEANPLRAKIVKDIRDWPWSSFAVRQDGASFFKLSNGPIELPGEWEKLVNEYVESKELADLEKSFNRGMPFGNSDWRLLTAKKLGLESTMRAKGRPKK